MAVRVMDRRLSEAGLGRGRESVVEIRATPAAQSLLKSYAVSVRHHIVQNGVYGAVGGQRREEQKRKTMNV